MIEVSKMTIDKALKGNTNRGIDFGELAGRILKRIKVKEVENMKELKKLVYKERDEMLHEENRPMNLRDLIEAKGRGMGPGKGKEDGSGIDNGGSGDCQTGKKTPRKSKGYGVKGGTERRGKSGDRRGRGRLSEMTFSKDGGRQDGTGSGKCYTDSPEANLKKFRTYAKYKTAAMKSMGKDMGSMKKSDWALIGKGWKSEAEKQGK